MSLPAIETTLLQVQERCIIMGGFEGLSIHLESIFSKTLREIYVRSVKGIWIHRNQGIKEIESECFDVVIHSPFF